MSGSVEISGGRYFIRILKIAFEKSRNLYIYFTSLLKVGSIFFKALLSAILNFLFLSKKHLELFTAVKDY